MVVKMFNFLEIIIIGSFLIFIFTNFIMYLMVAIQLENFDNTCDRIIENDRHRRGI